MLRLRQIALVANDLESIVDELRAALGIEVAHRDPAVAQFGLHNAVLPIGDQFLEVVSPTTDSTAAGRYLDRRSGDGGYMVILQCDGHGQRKARLADLGVRFALGHDTAEYKLLQLRPADTGGSFLEIDEQTGGEEMDGPWEPAGPDWQSARRTDLVSGIVGATLQSNDPERLAKRWGELLDCPPEPADDEWVIELDNAALRFTEATDGRGEGLAGLQLAGTSAHHMICGVDIRVTG